MLSEFKEKVNLRYDNQAQKEEYSLSEKELRLFLVQYQWQEIPDYKGQEVEHVVFGLDPIPKLRPHQ